MARGYIAAQKKFLTIMSVILFLVRGIVACPIYFALVVWPVDRNSL